ncbi:tyrosine-type recombinase/integrase [Synechococcus sp. J7-Johnson]|uniref:tyrosine-type recombinase/integrase n=1 Tax=Synechococcus sp. J7-Johnson TaxID=2823737 RepID=UPI0028F45F2C|nr:tyrosine-type recombinase/integrase [Synechococcus sp. J7-Johnson]
MSKVTSCHTFRHSFADHLLEGRRDIHAIQELLGNRVVSAPMNYSHVLCCGTLGPCSLAD